MQNTLTINPGPINSTLAESWSNNLRVDDALISGGQTTTLAARIVGEVGGGDGTHVGLVEVAIDLVLVESSADVDASLSIVECLGHKDVESGPRCRLSWGVLGEQNCVEGKFRIKNSE